MIPSTKKIAAILIGFALISVVLSASFVYFTYFSPSTKKTTVVEIPRGLGVRGIGVLLEKSGVIKSEEIFAFYAVVKNAQNKLRAGEYLFGSGESMSQIIERLVNGDIIVRKITIPEGLTIDQIARLLDSNGIISKEKFIQETKSIKLVRELLGESVSSFEGYLFPDTYSYTKGITSEELIRVMVSGFKKVYE
ncbi:MAG: endolytic transglycosylase MltG, partial [Thermodesulfobacteriota bacterium]